MSEHMTRFNAVNLLEQLESKGLTANEEVADFVIDQQQKRVLPFYIKALFAAGVFIALPPLFYFIEITEIFDFDHDGFLIIWGLLFVAVAIKLQRIAAGHNNMGKHGFHMLYMHSSIAIMMMGKVLFTYGVVLMPDWAFTDGEVTYWAFPWALLIITGMTYHIYRIEIDRFLSSFAVLFLILVNIQYTQDIGIPKELLLNGFFLLQFASAAILLTHGKIKRDYIPLCYALVGSLSISVLIASFSALFTSSSPLSPLSAIFDSIFINIVLTSGLIALFGWAAGGMEKLKREPLAMASIGAVLLGLLSAPGILLAIGLMILGYAKHEKPLIIVSALLMPVFLFLYYYNLDISLMQKSGVLTGSGIVLLAGRLYLKHRRWDAEGASCR